MASRVNEGRARGELVTVAGAVQAFPCHRSARRKSASLARLQVENGRSQSAGLDLAIFLISAAGRG